MSFSHAKPGASQKLDAGRSVKRRQPLSPQSRDGLRAKS